MLSSRRPCLTEGRIAAPRCVPPDYFSLLCLTHCALTSSSTYESRHLPRLPSRRKADNSSLTYSHLFRAPLMEVSTFLLAVSRAALRFCKGSKGLLLPRGLPLAAVRRRKLAVSGSVSRRQPSHVARSTKFHVARRATSSVEVSFSRCQPTITEDPSRVDGTSARAKSTGRFAATPA